MSNLTDLLPAGAGGKQVSFVASGTLASGQTVALKADGTVEVVGETAISQSVGTPVVFEAANSTFTSTVYDATSDKIVIVYRDNGNSGYGTAIVGTVSGTSITFGTAVVFETASTEYISATYDSTNSKVVIAYQDAGNSLFGTAIVGTVSGTSISFGTAVVFNSAAVYEPKVTFDSGLGKVVIAYRDNGNGNYGTAIVGTVSGTSISFGSEVVFQTSLAIVSSIVYDSTSSKIVVAFQGTSNYGYTVVGTVSGTSISFGTSAVFRSAYTDYMSLAFDSTANKIVLACRSSSGLAFVGTVSGTSISFGDFEIFNGESQFISATYDPNANKTTIAYKDQPNSGYGTAIVGTVSGTSISFGSEVVFATSDSQQISSAYDSSSNKIVIGYSNSGNPTIPGEGTSVVFQNASTATNNTSFIGISDAAISDTASGSVTIKGGISTNVTGLTPNALYYVQADGVLASGSVPYSISGASYDSVSFSVIVQDAVPVGIAFNTDGTKMFIVGNTGDDVNEYTLSNGFDVSTASFVDSFSVAAQDDNPRGIAFNTDGTKMFVTGTTGQDVNEYTLSNGFDVSTASFVDSFSVAGQETQPTAIAFNTDGTKMFIVGVVGDDVNEYTLSNGFDVSTASFVDSFSVSGQDTFPYGLAFNTDGTKMFVLGYTGQDINEYALSNGFDVSTASFVGNFSVAAQDTQPVGLTFSTNGTKIFIVGLSTDSVFQYSTTPASTTVLAGKALSSTSINLDYTT